MIHILALYFSPSGYLKVLYFEQEPIRSCIQTNALCKMIWIILLVSASSVLSLAQKDKNLQGHSIFHSSAWFSAYQFCTAISGLRRWASGMILFWYDQSLGKHGGWISKRYQVIIFLTPDLSNPHNDQHFKSIWIMAVPGWFFILVGFVFSHRLITRIGTGIMTNFLFRSI